MQTSTNDGNRWLTFDRSDRIGLVIMLWLVAVAAVGTLVVAPLVAWVRGATLPVPLLSEIVVPELDSAGLGHSLAGYDVLLENPSVGQRLLVLVPGLALAAVVVACVVLCLRVVRAIGSGDPFATGQVGRLRAIAALLAFGVPVIELGRAALSGLVLSPVDLGGLDPVIELTIPWLPIVVGLCVALVAEAFRAGAALREDVEGLV